MATLIPPTPIRGIAPTHPGAFLNEIVLPELKAAGTPKARFAELLGIDRTTFYQVLRGERPVTADLALKLGQLLGNGPTLWMNMQAAHDLWVARERLGAALEALPTLKVA